MMGLLQEARKNQMELDEREFLLMCKEIASSSTFILDTDELGNLEDWKLQRLWDFVRNEKKELHVEFEATFREEHCKKNARGEVDEKALKNIVKKMLEVRLMKRPFNKSVKPWDVKNISKSLQTDEEKKCRIETLEDCQARSYIRRVQQECGCVAWALTSALMLKVIRDYLI